MNSHPNDQSEINNAIENQENESPIEYQRKDREFYEDAAKERQDWESDYRDAFENDSDAEWNID